MQGKRGVGFFVWLLILFLSLVFILTSVYAQESKLVITDIDVYVDGNKDSSIDKNGGTIDDVKPGSELLLKIKISNLYSTKTEIEIENIAVEATIFDINNGKNIYKYENDFDLDAGDDEKIIFQFRIPYEVDEKEYLLNIKAQGIDDANKSVHATEVNISIDIEKEKHDVIFKNQRVSPSILGCYGSAVFEAEIVNRGSKKEDVTLVLENEELKIRQNEYFILEDDEDNIKYIMISLNPINRSKGIYALKAKLYYDNKEKITEIPLTIDCEKKSEKQDVIFYPQNNLSDQIRVWSRTSTGTSIAMVKYKTLNETQRTIIYSLGVVFVDLLLLLILLIFLLKNTFTGKQYY